MEHHRSWCLQGPVHVKNKRTAASVHLAGCHNNNTTSRRINFHGEKFLSSTPLIMSTNRGRPTLGSPSNQPTRSSARDSEVLVPKIIHSINQSRNIILMPAARGSAQSADWSGGGGRDERRGRHPPERPPPRCHVGHNKSRRRCQTCGGVRGETL